METPEAYDPDDDLAAQRAGGPVRVGLGFMLAASVFELGGFLQHVVAIVDQTPPWLAGWIWAKLPLALLALYSVIRASRLRAGSLRLWAATASLLVVESCVFLPVMLNYHHFSCFALASVLPAIVALFVILPLREGTARAHEARERLAAHGIDDAF